MATFTANLRLFAHITNTLAKDKEISDRWRGFKDVAGSRHLANRVEPEVVDALVAAVRAAYPRLSHRYYALKARWMASRPCDHWDRNAPLPDDARPPCRWRKRRAIVLGRLSPLSPAIADVARAVSWTRPGSMRRSGPASHQAPTPIRGAQRPPLRAPQLSGQRRDVLTLAHELGHGVHQTLAAPQGTLWPTRR